MDRQTVLHLDSCWVLTVLEKMPGRPKMTWTTLTERDRWLWNLNEVDPCDRDVWRSRVRSAMHAASQLPRREPTDVDDAPASAC